MSDSDTLEACPARQINTANDIPRLVDLVLHSYDDNRTGEYLDQRCPQRCPRSADNIAAGALLKNDTLEARTHGTICDSSWRYARRSLDRVPRPIWWHGAPRLAENALSGVESSAESTGLGGERSVLWLLPLNRPGKVGGS